MPSLLILVRIACIYQVCIHSATVIQPPTLTTKKRSQQGTDGALEWISNWHWSMPSLLIWVRNACIYQVCIHSAIVIQPPTHTAKNCSWQVTDGALEWISIDIGQCHLCWSCSEMLASTRYANTQPLWYNLLPLRQRKYHSRYRWSPGMDQ